MKRRQRKNLEKRRRWLAKYRGRNARELAAARRTVRAITEGASDGWELMGVGVDLGDGVEATAYARQMPDGTVEVDCKVKLPEPAAHITIDLPDKPGS